MIHIKISVKEREGQIVNTDYYRNRIRDKFTVVSLDYSQQWSPYEGFRGIMQLDTTEEEFNTYINSIYETGDKGYVIIEVGNLEDLLKVEKESISQVPEIVDYKWQGTGFNLKNQTLGFVKVKHEFSGQFKVYVGFGKGNDEEEDIQIIARTGGKVVPEVAVGYFGGVISDYIF